MKYALALATAALLLPACAPHDDAAAADSDRLALVSTALVDDAGMPPPDPLPPPPPPPRERMPSIIRGIYVNAYATARSSQMERLLALTDSTEINAWVVDVKDDDGIRFASETPLARELSHGRIPIRDLEALVDTLRAHDIHPIARIVVFKDRRLAQARPEWAIRTPGGAAWEDKAGNLWTSPWEREVWAYNLDVAEEAARAGFREIQFDYVRFPEPYRSLPLQVHRSEPWGDREQAIAGFLRAARERLHPLGVTVSADLFGASMNEATDVGIGHQWETLSAVADHLLPMVYPSHYFPTHLPGIRRPNRMPYETVLTSVGMGVLRNRRLQDEGARPARIIPWIQGFTATWMDREFRYGPEQAEAQMRAVYDLGLEDWIFWHPGSRYDDIAGAFAPRTESRARPYEGGDAVRRVVERFEREGAAEARERARMRAGAAAPGHPAVDPPSTPGAARRIGE